MSQIFGVGGYHDLEQLRRALQRMGTIMRRPQQTAPVVWVDSKAGIGLGFVPEHTDRSPAETHNDATQGDTPCAVDGVFYRGALHGHDTTARTELAAFLTQRGGDAIPALDGSFSFAAYLANDRQLLLANDRFGTRTLYWRADPRRIVFASELKAVMAVPEGHTEVDRAALTLCAGYNRILDERTLVRGVARLRGGSIVTWRETEGASLRRYWRIDDAVAQRSVLTPQRRDEIAEAFRDSVKLRTTAGPVGISLSGGLDSRAIAAVLGAEGIAATSVTTGFAGSADQRLAAQISSATNLDHHFFELRKEAIANYQEAVRAAVFTRDGMALVGGFPATLTQDFCVQHGIRTLLRGHGGENAKLAEAWPFQVTLAVLAMRDTNQLRTHLRRGLATCPADIDLDRLLGRPQDATGAAATLDAGIDGVVGEYRGLSPAEIMSVLYLAQNDGIEVPITRNGLRGLAEMALPFLDYRLLDLLLGTRIQDRCDTSLHVDLVRRFTPALLRVPNSNTGAPMNASPLRVLVTDKANTLLKRLRVPGFRHYHYMEEWLKGFLAAEVRAIVLDERTLSRGVFARDYVVAIMDRARSDSSVSRLVNFIMNFEIWCRLFLDGEAFANLPRGGTATTS